MMESRKRIEFARKLLPYTLGKIHALMHDDSKAQSKYPTVLCSTKKAYKGKQWTRSEPPSVDGDPEYCSHCMRKLNRLIARYGVVYVDYPRI